MLSVPGKRGNVGKRKGGESTAYSCSAKRGTGSIEREERKYRGSLT